MLAACPSMGEALVALAFFVGTPTLFIAFPQLLATALWMVGMKDMARSVESGPARWVVTATSLALGVAGCGALFFLLTTEC